MRGFARHPALDGQLVIRHLELRHEDEHGHLRLLRVVPSEGARVHGLSSSLYIGDEIWAWAGDDLALGAEVRPCDPRLERLQRLVDQLAELREASEPGTHTDGHRRHD